MTLNIIHVITTIEFGGAENQLLILARHQQKLGNKVSIFYLKGKPELRDAFEKIGVNVFYGDSSFIKSAFTLAKILKGPFHIAHAHLPRSEVLLALANVLSRRRRILVATRHNSEPFFPNAPILFSPILSRFILRSYKGIIFISHTVKDFAMNKKECRQDFNFKVIHYGYDDEILKFQSINSNPKREVARFLFIGRLVKQKNVPFLLRAFRKHLETFPDSSLEIYGGGIMESDLRSSVADLTKNIIWRGRSANIPEIMRSSTCLVLPSKYEGFGLVLLEAMMMGLPILAADTSAIPEVLGEEHPGLYKGHGVDSLSNKMNDIRKSNIVELILSHQNQRIQLFNPTTMTQKTYDFYLSCMPISTKML
jgi:glycosyltransferase involved in cell wall biosynthesis